MTVHLVQLRTPEGERCVASVAADGRAYRVGGLSSLYELAQAAADSGKLSIGVDSNQNYLHPGSGLTSMLKRVDTAVHTSFNEAGDDATFEPGLVDLGLSDEGVGYALDEHNAELITEEMQQRVDELKAQVIAGEIEVHDYYTDNACPY